LVSPRPLALPHFSPSTRLDTRAGRKRGLKWLYEGFGHCFVTLCAYLRSVITVLGGHHRKKCQKPAYLLAFLMVVTTRISGTYYIFSLIILLACDRSTMATYQP
jgi:hypothetical protein